MGSYSGTCEIVEAKEELSSVKHSKGTYQSHSGLSLGGSNRKPPLLKLGYKDSLEDDINQLFEAMSLKNSPRFLGSEAGTSMSPLRKNAMKRPISVPHSPRAGNAEPVSLKQALRELCLSKASEMAAMKRLSKPMGSPRASEAGRIKNLYNSVVLETGRSGHPMAEGTGTMVEISLVPEESESKCFKDKLQQLQMLKIKSSSQSAQSSPRLHALKSANQSAQSSPRLYALKSTNRSAETSPRFAVPTSQIGSSAMPKPNETVYGSREVGVQATKSPNQSALSSPRFAVPKTQCGTGTTLVQNEIGSTSKKFAMQTPKSPIESAHSSPRFAVPTTHNGTGATSTQSDIVSVPRKVRAEASKTDIVQKEKHTTATSLSCSDSVDSKLEPDIYVPEATKSPSKGSAPRSARKGRVHTSPSSHNGSRVSKVTRNAPRLARPVVRNKSSVKKKSKQGTSGTACLSNEANNCMVPTTGQLVCQKCQCTLNIVTENSCQVAPSSFLANLSTDITSSYSKPIAKPDLTSGNCNRSKAAAKAKRNSKSREKGEFSQSSKSSLGDFSTSTSNSDESNASRSSCANRPHMSKDIRWEAIRYVKMRDGVLSLRHFNLLKKLGCGDIGTVYLAELIGPNCLFALKVMDNEFLARRKKMPRAQTEREILRMLDHPFLPTLYAQFTSDNLSCLVMEYCPGGDLHVLRQKQPGRCFPEPAARFYVAEVLLALEYLHMLGIVYRDLKPENILVREDGHIMLTDFDLSLRCSVNPTLLQSPSTDADPARISGPCTESRCIQPFCIEPSCKVTCFSPRFIPAAAKGRKLKAEIAAQARSLPQLVAEPTEARSNSFVGTHEYLAPEIIKGEGHGAAVDWWTFGVFLYELLYGRTPFKGPGNEETLANVVLQTLKFPDSPLVSFHARDLIKSLLVKEPEYRLGSEKGAAEIKQHPFFEGLNWALIRCAIPPELPDSFDFGVRNVTSRENNNNINYLECKATGEQLEFELF